MQRALVILLVILVCVVKNFAEDVNDKKHSDHERVLSRKKRYLIFPEGSSIQLVYCFTIPIYANFVFATTAALAWMLPTSPQDVLPLRYQKRNNTERIDTAKITYKKEVLKKPMQYTFSSGYYKNPTNYRVHYMQFPQQVQYQTVSFSPSFKDSYNRRRFYPSSSWKNPSYRTNHAPVTAYANPVDNEWHRRSRRHLFGKIEKFFEAQRKDGKSCLLKAVCEVSQTAGGGKGTFVQEIVKAIFRIHPSHVGEEDTYDVASKAENNCTELYPMCDFSLWEVL
ncbi:hypothetical protein Trydic_g19179 [Trypoxylus dichotomus]